MKNIHRRLSAGLACLGLLAMIASPMSASAQALDRIKKAETLRLGFIDRLAPYSSLGADGKPAGYTIDLCRVVADAVKAKLALPALKVDFVALSAEAAAKAVEQGQVDLLCTGAVETLKRREQASFSIPIASGGIGVAVRTDAPAGVRDVLSGKAVQGGPVWRATVNGGATRHTYAVRADTVTEAWAREQVRRLGVSIGVVVVDDDIKGMELLKSGQVDAYISERALLKDYVERNKAGQALTVLERRFKNEPLSLVMARNDDDFRLLVDTALSRLLGSKEFAVLYGRYFGPLDENSRQIYAGFALP